MFKAIRSEKSNFGRTKRQFLKDKEELREKTTQSRLSTSVFGWWERHGADTQNSHWQQGIIQMRCMQFTFTFYGIKKLKD